MTSTNQFSPLKCQGCHTADKIYRSVGVSEGGILTRKIKCDNCSSKSIYIYITS